MRLVSLLPSATEIVYSLGLGEDLVGVTFECDEPPEARSEKTIVVGGRDTRGMTAGEIDSYVREQLAAGADLYTLHAQALADLQPDLILTQDLCRVCALPSGQVEQALTIWAPGRGAVDDPHSLDDVLDSILVVGRRTGVPDRAARLAGDLRARLARIAAGSPGGAARRPQSSNGSIRRSPPGTGYPTWSTRRGPAGGGPAGRALSPDHLGCHHRSGTGTHHRRAMWLPSGLARLSRHSPQPWRCPAYRSGRSTPTASWSAQDPG